MSATLPTPALAPATHALERTPEEWADTLEGWGQPRYRGLQVFRWLHQRGVLDPAAMTDLPKALRARLEREDLAPPLSVAKQLDAADGTTKLLLSLSDTRAVETVLIPMTSGQTGDGYAPEPDDEDAGGATDGARWVTQCVSSQVGCAMGCGFCASGIAGLKRHLSAAEVVGQVMLGRALLRPRGEDVRNVVFMGMGEPLHHYDALARALVLLVHPEGLGLSKRRVTVSTSGLVPEIDRLGRDFGGQVQLAVSLHAVDDARRSSIMPINRKYPIAELLAALRRYPLPRRRRITIEYTLIEGFNASPADARALARLLRGIRCKVNLIPLNQVPGSPLRAPSGPAVDAFQDALRGEGVPTFVRQRKGDDIAAACGQLALAGERRKVKPALPAIG